MCLSLGMGFADALQFSQDRMVRGLVQQAAFENQHPRPRVEELARDRQSGRATADYNQISLEHRTGFESAKTFDFNVRSILRKAQDRRIKPKVHQRYHPKSRVDGT